MKPLYGLGGQAVFRLARDDLNFGSLYDLFAPCSANLCGGAKVPARR